MLDSNVASSVSQLYKYIQVLQVLISVVFNKHFLLGSMKPSLSPYVYQV